MSEKEDFFNIQNEKSRIKSLIVSKYFYYWAKIMSSIIEKNNGSNRVVYMDIFCGPGYYEDGSESTPILVLKNIIRDDLLSKYVRPVFNDNDTESVEELEENCKKLAEIDRLNYKPKFFKQSIGSGIFAKWLEHNLPPTLLFADPWGYKGMSLDLFKRFLENWGCEVIMFFNYRRINAAINNDVLFTNMKRLFGNKIHNLKEELNGLTPSEREVKIIETIKDFFSEAFEESFVLDFKFIDDFGTRTTHHIIHISRHPLAFKGMKEIMHEFSTEKSQGIATQLEFNPQIKRMPRLFDFEQPIEELKKSLLSKYSGRKITFKKIFEVDQKKTLFIEKHYKEAIRQLELEENIITDPKPTNRRQYKGKLSIPNSLKIKFE